MKKLLLAIYLTLMVSTLNGETVKKENVKWIKLKDYYKIDRKNIEKGIVYQEVKGKNYKCGEIINGEKEGKWIYWYENGQKKSEENYVKGKEEGKYISWYKNGQKKEEINFKNGNPEGKWIEWYENGQKKFEITCKDDKFINWTYWKKNGERVDILTTTSTGEKIIRLIDDNTIDKDMKDDEIESMGYLFLYIMSDTKNATIYQEIKGKDYKWGEVKDGKREGKWIEYYENGQKKEEGNYLKGNLEGKYVSWYENGQKEKEVTYKDSEKIKGIYWNEDGEIIGTITKNSAGQRIIKLSSNDAEIMLDVTDGIVYREIKGKEYKCGELKDGIKEGKWIEWYENGQKREEVNYLKGNPEGKWIKWHENGKKESEVTYRDGEKVKGVYWDEDGEIIGRITKNNAGKRIIKLSGGDDEILQDVRDGIIYREIKGKEYKCGELKDGIKEGKWIFWYENGHKSEEINYVKGKEEGKYISWYENGQKKKEVTYKDGEEIKGVYWNEKGQIIGRITINSAGKRIIKLSGDDEEILPGVRDGIVYREIKGKDYKWGEVKDGKREGKWISWYENGQKKEEINYVNGKEEGKWIEWYENGQKKEEIDYVNGKEEGKWISWYENGQKGLEGNYADGEKEGNWIEWYENGQKGEEGNYVNGKEEGKWISWYENGQKRLEGNYADGEKEGNWIEWYESGQKKSEVTYRDGEKVKGVYWNEKGEIIGIITKNSAGKRIIKLSGDDEEILRGVKNGIVYQEINGKDYKCGELKDGEREGEWIEWNENGEKKSEVTYKDDEEIKRIEYDENGNRIEE